MKSRGVYEKVGGAILYYAHAELEHLCLDRQNYSFKQTVSQKLTEVIYGGLWFTPLREALTAFVDVTQKTVTGKVCMKLDNHADSKGLIAASAKLGPTNAEGPGCRFLRCASCSALKPPSLALIE